MVKMTPAQRSELRNDVRQMQAAGRKNRDIKMILGAKYGLQPQSVRWYLESSTQAKTETNGKPRESESGDGQSEQPPSAATPKHKKQRKPAPNRLAPALGRSRHKAIKELLGNFSGPELRAFADARDLVEKAEIHVARARKLAQKIMDCRMSLRLTYRDIRVGHSLLRKKQREREMLQRRLARLAEQLKDENASALSVRKEARNRFWNAQAAG